MIIGGASAATVVAALVPATARSTMTIDTAEARYEVVDAGGCVVTHVSVSATEARGSGPRAVSNTYTTGSLSIRRTDRCLGRELDRRPQEVSQSEERVAGRGLDGMTLSARWSIHFFDDSSGEDREVELAWTGAGPVTTSVGARERRRTRAATATGTVRVDGVVVASGPALEASLERVDRW